MDFVELGGRLALMYVPFLFALCFHEFAHGWVAKLRGDNTAEISGRLTMNPLAHLDWIGTVALPIISIMTHSPIFFGWAKPVPVNERNLKRPRVDMFWIALAGPLSNILLGLIGSLFLTMTVGQYFGVQLQKPLGEFLQQFVLINLFLAVFNLIPLHPLDGGKVLARFLPPALNYKLERNAGTSSLILFFLLLTGVLRFLVIPVIFMYQTMLSLFGTLLHV